MAELKIRLDLSFGARSLRAFMAASMVLSAVTEVASESVTLTTYYPAPSGVYAQMITTGMTYLARDSGNVGIGTVSPGAKLEVSGDVKVTGTGIYNAAGFQLVETNQTDWTRWNQGQGAAFGNAMYQSLALGNGGLTVGNWENQPSGVLKVLNSAYLASSSGNVGIGTTSPVYKLDIVGTSQMTDMIATDINCFETNYYIDDIGNPPSLCPAGEYATATAGVIAWKTIMPLYSESTFGSPGTVSNATAPMFCCVCPAGGCPNLP